MEARVVSITNQGFQPVVKVDFVVQDIDKAENGTETPVDRVIHSKNYFLDAGQTIDDIKPQIKDDLDRAMKVVEDMNGVSPMLNKKVDLEGVEGVEEKKAREKAEKEVEEKSKK